MSSASGRGVAGHDEPRGPQLIRRRPGRAAGQHPTAPETDSAEAGGREVGVAAVERGPAELSSEGEPERPLPHASLDEGAGKTRSTDDL